MMTARPILASSAAFLFAGGAAALFAPDELAGLLESRPPPGTGLLIQLLASGMLGFAILNWMSRGQRVGGIYARPLALANTLLFATAALTLGKAVSAGRLPADAAILCGLAAIFAAGFAWLAFVHDPLAKAGRTDG